MKKAKKEEKVRAVACRGRGACELTTVQARLKAEKVAKLNAKLAATAATASESAAKKKALPAEPLPQP